MCLYSRISSRTYKDLEMMNIKSSLLCSVVIVWLAVCVDSQSDQSRVFMTARVGSSVVLPCEWRDVLSPSPHIEWRTLSETVFERLGEEHYEGEGYEGRVDVPEDKLKKGNCSLELKNVKAEDAGVYQSYLMVKQEKSGLDSKQVQSVELSVDESPEDRSFQRFVVTDDAGMISPHLLTVAFSLFLYLFTLL
uniref:Ig-like domain-containing protein n=1 Tax=Astyanax mexicanus TaxID=7994 RepID=A0A3B1IVB3_ASTMX